MNETATITIIVAVFGAFITIIQALGLWILTDMRRRVERVETHIMEGKR